MTTTATWQGPLTEGAARRVGVLVADADEHAAAAHLLPGAARVAREDYLRAVVQMLAESLAGSVLAPVWESVAYVRETAEVVAGVCRVLDANPGGAR